MYIKILLPSQSLKSCGYVKEQFAWRHFYWYVTNEGIQYLRDFLHLPPEIVPATLRRQTRPETARPRPKGKRLIFLSLKAFQNNVFYLHDFPCYILKKIHRAFPCNDVHNEQKAIESS